MLPAAAREPPAIAGDGEDEEDDEETDQEVHVTGAFLFELSRWELSALPV
jgi:hypothetical protein